MALNFSDPQVKTITKDIFGLPAVVTSLENDKVIQVEQKANFLETDEQNKVFSDNFIGILTQYLLEKLEINGVVHSNYTEQFIQDAPLKKNDHFQQSPIWANFPPKVLPENNGDPISNNANFETVQISTGQGKITELKTGYTDGAIDDTATEAPTSGVVEVDTGGFVIGERIVIDDGGDDLIAVIDDIVAPSTTGAEDLEYTIIAGSESGLGAGARVRNFHPGFSDDERENVSVPDTPNTMAHFKTQVDSEVQKWEDFLTPQQSALTGNDALDSEAAEIATALTNVQNAISDIDTWQVAPASGDGVGKYGDTVLAPLEARLVTRTTQAPARITEIDTAIGSVTQDPNTGSFSGNGNFKRLFDFVDLRINLAGGSLQRFIRADLNIIFFDQQINGANTQLTEYGNIFLVKILSADGNGSEFVTLTDVSGLAIGNTVKLMDNDSSVFTRVIDDIQGNTIELDSAIGVNLLVDKLARLAKEL